MLPTWIKVLWLFCFHFTAPLVTATSSCANLLTSQTNTDGEIKSNSFGGSYSNNMDCRWNLSSNAKIELAFLRFNTQLSNDFVKVYNGGSSSSPLIGTFSGSSLPSPIQSSSRNLYVKFTSDGSGTYKGFLAHYRGKMIVIYVFSYLCLQRMSLLRSDSQNFY